MTDRPNPTAIRVRPAAFADLNAVRQVLVETWHDTYDALLGREKVGEITARWHAVPVLASQIDVADTVFLVAGAEGGIAGHAFADFRRPPVGHLRRLYVLPAWQRRGIGALLLSAALEGHSEIERIALNVEAANAKAVNFYRRQGFTVAGRTPVDGVECLQMERDRS